MRDKNEEEQSKIRQGRGSKRQEKQAVQRKEARKKDQNNVNGEEKSKRE